MKQGSKNGCRCAPKSKGLRGKLATRFCIIHKVKPAESSSDQYPVYLNVYDLTPANGYVYWAGLGIFHSGVEVHGVEYAFGAHDLPTSGVFELAPQQCPGFKFRRSIYMGTTSFGPKEVRELMEIKSNSYTGDSYHLIAKNCNHFTDDICHNLIGKGIPRWVNRMAKIGHCCNCILPETLKVTRVPKDSVLEKHNEKKQQKSGWTESKMEMPVTSISICCQSNGCIMPWEPRPEKLVMEK